MNIGNDVCLCGFGRRDCSIDLHLWGPGIRKVYIIHYIIKGAGYLECNKKKYRIEAGQSFIIYPDSVVSYYPDNKMPYPSAESRNKHNSNYRLKGF